MPVQLEGELTLQERTEKWRQASKQAVLLRECPFCGARAGKACRTRSSGIPRVLAHVRRIEAAAVHLRRLGIRVLPSDFDRARPQSAGRGGPTSDRGGDAGDHLSTTNPTETDQ